MTETALQAERTVDTVTTEINTLHNQARKMILTYAVEIGRRLLEVKGMLPHGAWGDYVKDRTPYSQSTANNFMRIYEAYGDQNISLFGDPQPVGSLSYTQALELLALPSKDREEFLRENQVEDMSRRELQKAIRERNEAREEAERMKAAARALEEAEAQAKAAEQARQKMEEDMGLLNERIASMNEELCALREKPVDVPLIETDPAELEQARQEGAEAAKRELMAEMEKMEADLAKARKKEEKAKKAAEEAQARAAEMTAEAENQAARLAGEADAWKRKAEAAQKAADNGGKQDLSAFQLLFEQLQEGANRMGGIIRNMSDRGDDETAKKLRKAMEALGHAVLAEAGDAS